MGLGAPALAVALGLVGGSPPGMAAPPPAPAAALIQLKGPPLAAGRVTGSARVVLERAAEGDTPVLRLVSPAGEVRLLLDTGASVTLVTPALGRRLGLRGRSVPPGAFALAGGGSGCADLRPQLVRLPALELRGAGGTVRFDGVEALQMRVDALPEGVDGVLGAPTLRRVPILVEPLAGRLALGAAALGPAAPDPAAGRRIVPLRWHRGVPLLDLSGPTGPLAALADTGAEGLFLSPALARQLEPSGPPESLRLVGFCGEQPVLRRRFRGLALAAASAPVPAATPWREAIVTDNPIFRELGVEAIVGQELLRERSQLWRLDLPSPRLELW